MRNEYAIARSHWRGWILYLGVGSLLMILLSGCMGNYGRLNRNPEVFQAFENNHVPTDYRYYYYGFDTRPYVIIGVEPKYDAASRMWQEVEPNTEQFKNMTIWIWEDYGYSRYGARILDPSGNPVGILFSSIQEISVKFSADNHLTVMPNMPFLWGPAADKDVSDRFYGRVVPDPALPVPLRAANP